MLDLLRVMTAKPCEPYKPYVALLIIQVLVSTTYAICLFVQLKESLNNAL